MSEPPYRILMVEGRRPQSEYVRGLFQEQGVHDIEVVRNGIDALRQMEVTQFDLVLCNLLMPGLDGMQFIQRLAALKWCPPLAIISSASRRMMASASLVAQALGLSVLGMISKPAGAEAIRSLLEKLKHAMPTAGQLPPEPPLHFHYDDLLEALEKGEMQAWFQPKKSLANGRIVSAEALVRWQHPDLGVLLPSAFLPAVERHGLDEALLWCVLEQALRAQGMWAASGYGISVAVNLPTHLLDAEDLPDRLEAFVVRHGGKPADICFEMTEGSTTRLPGNGHAGAWRLRAKGFALAQDDFGQGYSSFYNLVSTPYTELKIDRTLVHGSAENDVLETALASLITLGHRLNLIVVAEGVQELDELNLLRRLGCDWVQGFLISPPSLPDVLGRRLATDGPPRT